MPKVTPKRKYFINKYRPNRDSSSNVTIKPGLIGILATTNGNTGLAVKQLYHCLNELNGDSDSESITEDTDEINNGDDIDKMIEKEKQQIKKFKYKSLPTKLKNTLFISSTDEKNPSPNEITTTIFKDLQENDLNSKFKLTHCLRVLPISFTTMANDSSIEETIKNCVRAHFNSENITYSILAKVSFNDNYGSTKLKELVRNSIDPTHYKLDYNNADIHIWIQVIRNICFIGVLDNYNAFKKYNVSQLNEHKCDVAPRDGYNK